MKAKFTIEQDANYVTCPEEYKSSLRLAKRENNGVEVLVWTWPVDAVVSGDLAIQIVMNGQGIPIDEECRKACGLDDAELAHRQLEYEMTNKGIHNKEDREMYRDGVILGYDVKGNYIPGPAWDEYQKAKKALEEKDDI